MSETRHEAAKRAAAEFNARVPVLAVVRYTPPNNPRPVNVCVTAPAEVHMGIAMAQVNGFWWRPVETLSLEDV